MRTNPLGALPKKKPQPGMKTGRGHSKDKNHKDTAAAVFNGTKAMEAAWALGRLRRAIVVAGLTGAVSRPRACQLLDVAGLGLPMANDRGARWRVVKA